MPTMNYTVEKDGQTDVVDDNHVMNEFRSMGYPVQGVSADGMHMIVQEPGPKGQPGPMQKWPIHAALQQAGFKVHDAQPDNPDKDTVEPMMSGMLNTLPEDDSMRKTYIEHTLKSRGISEPQVTGSGQSWHVFNPNTNQWAQLTEDPKISNLSGLAAGAMALPHMVGGALGGAGGLALGSGPASIPLGMAGAALGSAAGSGIERLAMSALDPSYADALKGHLNEVGTDILGTAGMDALGEGVAGPLIKALPIRPMAKIAGSAFEGAGNLMAKGAGKVANSDALTALATDFSPIDTISGMGMTGQMAQMPAAAVKLAGKIPGKLAQHPVTAPFFSEEGNAAAQNLSHALGAKGWSAENVLGGFAGGRAKQAAAKYGGDAAAKEQEQLASEAAQALAKQYGIHGSEELGEIGSGMAGDYRAKEISRLMSQMGSEENWGSAVGRGLDQLSAAGQGIEGLGRNLTRAGLRGIQGVGVGARTLGKAIPPGADLAQYGGLPWAARYGLLPKLRQLYDEHNGQP